MASLLTSHLTGSKRSSPGSRRSSPGLKQPVNGLSVDVTSHRIQKVITRIQKVITWSEAACQRPLCWRHTSQDPKGHHSPWAMQEAHSLPCTIEEGRGQSFNFHLLKLLQNVFSGIFSNLTHSALWLYCKYIFKIHACWRIFCYCYNFNPMTYVKKGNF
jgi:hypothetical protein